MTDPITTLCGSCGATCDDERQCRHYGSRFDEGAPLVRISTEIRIGHGIRVVPRLEFAGHWRPERRRAIEDAIREPEREPLRLVHSRQR